MLRRLQDIWGWIRKDIWVGDKDLDDISRDVN